MFVCCVFYVLSGSQMPKKVIFTGTSFRMPVPVTARSKV
jgi:hypothetical protein